MKITRRQLVTTSLSSSIPPSFHGGHGWRDTIYPKLNSSMVIFQITNVHDKDPNIIRSLKWLFFGLSCRSCGDGWVLHGLLCWQPYRSRTCWSNGKFLLQNTLVCGCRRSSFHPQERRFRQTQGSDWRDNVIWQAMASGMERAGIIIIINGFFKEVKKIYGLCFLFCYVMMISESPKIISLLYYWYWDCNLSGFRNLHEVVRHEENQGRSLTL